VSELRAAEPCLDSAMHPHDTYRLTAAIPIRKTTRVETTGSTEGGLEYERRTYSRSRTRSRTSTTTVGRSTQSSGAPGRRVVAPRSLRYRRRICQGPRSLVRGRPSRAVSHRNIGLFRSTNHEIARGKWYPGVRGAPYPPLYRLSSFSVLAKRAAAACRNISLSTNGGSARPICSLRTPTLRVWWSDRADQR
jgi:hypothetical protein